MRPLTPFVAALVLPLILAACSKSAPPPGKVVTAENVCNEADGSRVRLTGYIRYSRGMMSFCQTANGRQTCDMSLYPMAEAPPDFDIMRPRTAPEPIFTKLSVHVGSDPGDMDALPEKFSASDVKVHIKQGEKTVEGGEGAKVTVDGTLSVVPGVQNVPKSCFVNVDWASPAT